MEAEHHTNGCNDLESKTNDGEKCCLHSHLQSAHFHKENKLEESPASELAELIVMIQSFSVSAPPAKLCGHGNDI